MSTCPHCDQIHPAGTDYCPRTGRPIADVADRMIGRTVAGKYKLTRCIGQGGMGTIFEAEHTLIGNRVAVKLLHEPFAAKREPVQRLYREAQATGVIGHPNIIKVHDVGETEEGVPFLVMELLDGESLGEHIERNGPRPLGFVLDVAIQMLSALNAAHQAGIIHRDLKSDNVFLLRSDDESLRIKILDFGISKIATPESEGLKLTQTGTLLGTPYYMSPEQASGKSDLDTRIDIYAAGVIIYETLLGTVPHRADNYNALLIEIITEDVAPFRYMRPDIPPRLEAAVLRALARSRDERWRTAVDLMEELVVIRRELPVSALHGAPIIGEWVAPVDRNSATLDISDVPASHRALSQLAFETGGGTIQPPARARMARTAAWAVGSVLLLGLIALGFVWMFDDEPETTEPGPVPEVAAEGEGAEGAGEAQLSTSVLLAVRATPQDALVTADGERVPEEGLYVARGTTPIKLRVEAEGFEPRTLEVVPVADLDLDVELEPLAAAETDTAAQQEPEGGSAGKGTKTGKGGGKRPPKVAETKPADTPPKKPAETPPKKPDKDHPLDRPMDNPF